MCQKYNNLSPAPFPVKKTGGFKEGKPVKEVFETDLYREMKEKKIFIKNSWLGIDKAGPSPLLKKSPAEYFHQKVKKGELNVRFSFPARKLLWIREVK